METKKYIIPEVILDKAEEGDLIKIKKAYEKMLEPKAIGKLANKAGELIPTSVKEKIIEFKDDLTEQEMYIKAMEYLAKSFNKLEKLASKATLSRTQVVKKVNEIVCDNEIKSLEEICLAREYDIYELVNKYKNADLIATIVEGGALGAVGFAGLIPNLILSTFLYYRAVQSIALFYGYDIKHDSTELQIASEVFTNALSPRNNTDSELSSVIAKVMLITEITTVKQTVKKGWTAMANKDAITLLLAQMRALANVAARKALDKAGKKGLEETMFTNVFEQIGKGLTQKNIGKAVPFVGAFIGATIDTAQMSQVIEYANLFYAKRFILEKEERVYKLVGEELPEIIIESDKIE